MRSEHLNDCAGFLDLPDAINKSSYLVRRLDDDELRDAIVRPAKRFLRLHRAPATSNAALPEAVVFEPARARPRCSRRAAITRPRPPAAAAARAGAAVGGGAARATARTAGLPDRHHLRRSGGGRHRRPRGRVAARRRCQRAARQPRELGRELYLRHTPEPAAQLDALLRRLAFKDPNTGMYTQQRIDVDDGAALLGAAHARRPAGADRRRLPRQRRLPVLGRRGSRARHAEGLARVAYPRLAALPPLIDAEAERFDELSAAAQMCVAAGRRKVAGTCLSGPADCGAFVTRRSKAYWRTPPSTQPRFHLSCCWIAMASGLPEYARTRCGCVLRALGRTTRTS